MKVVNYQEYDELKMAFIKKHKYDYKIDTSPMDEYGRYYKDYIFADGAYWHETMMPVYETVTVEVHKCNVSVEVKFLRTEFRNSDNVDSILLYEQY